MRSLIFALALGSTPALAAIVEVPQDYATLEEAVVAAAPGDRITLQTGTYDVAPMVIDKTLRIQAQDNNSVTITSSTGTGQIFEVVAGTASFDLRDLTFDGMGNPDLRVITSTGAQVLLTSDLTIRNFTTLGDGAFINVSNAVLTSISATTVENCSAVNGGAFAIFDTDVTDNVNVSLNIGDQSVITDSTASGDGGLIYAVGATLNISDTELATGSALDGGAIHATYDPPVDPGNPHAPPPGNPKRVAFENVSLTDSTAVELGGGIFAQGMDIEIEQSTFAGLSAGSGGAIWMDELLQETALEISDLTLFSMCEATGLGASMDGMAGTGGAIRAIAADVSLEATTFDQNLAIDGIVWAVADEVVLTDADFTTNAVPGNAGALMAVTPVLDIAGGSFNDNMADGAGGALHVTAPEADPAVFADITISGTGFERNSALGDGGALWTDGSVISIDESWFYDNGGNQGGAIFQTTAEQPLDVEDSRFFRNAAADGGAIHATGLTDITSSRNFWCANTATDDGGAVNATGTGVFTVRNDAGADNEAISGGVYRTSTFTHADVQYGTFVGNTGSTAGAVLYATDLTMPSTLVRVAATDNTGNAFEATGELPSPVDFNAFDANTADFGGDWSATVPTHPFVIHGDVPVYNSYPAASCEIMSLQPHPTVGTPFIDVGPTMLDIDGSLTDIGLSGGPDANPLLFSDGDGDGFNGLEDCDDTRHDAFPGATDFCNELDDNCNGIIDEDPDTVWYADLDDDGFGDPTAQLHYDPVCDQPEPHSAPNFLDCDDTRAEINPEADEVCDGDDNNCDLTTDTDAIDRPTWYQDLDFDGFGDDAVTQLACDQPATFVDQGGDCDDLLANVYPGAEEACDTIDNDCNGVVDNDGVNAPRWYPDADLDGYGTGTAVVSCLPPDDHSPYTGDCDDTTAARSPGNDEICDGIDNDCDDEIDVDPVSPTYFPDLDLDGYGDGNATPIGSCTPIAGLTTDGSDCNDHDAHINPDSEEACDGVDEDCNGQVDDNPTNGTAFYLDSDNDGFGDENFTINACTLPAIASEVAGDCDDNNNAMFPGNQEICDFFDNDCDGDVDEGDASDATVWYEDADDDGYGNDDATVLACRAPVRHVAVGDDCDDANPVAFPGRLEVCDGVDNDCNGMIDGSDAADVSYFYADVDGDGFGDPQGEVGACSVPDGHVSNSTDCNDNNPDVFPGAQEVPGNAIDEDCDGQALPGTPEDTDGDGDPKDCGCQSTAAPSGFFLPLLGLLLLRSRRR